MELPFLVLVLFGGVGVTLVIKPKFWKSLSHDHAKVDYKYIGNWPVLGVLVRWNLKFYESKKAIWFFRAMGIIYLLFVVWVLISLAG